MPAPTRPSSLPSSRLELLDESSGGLRLRPTTRLNGEPVEAGVDPRRRRASGTWRALSTPTDQVADELMELDRAERAMVATRKQLHAARAEAAAAKEQLAHVQQERFSPAVVWGLGAVAVVSLGGWVYQRRRQAGLHEQTLPPVESRYPESEMSLYGDDADPDAQSSVFPSGRGPKRS